VNLSIPDMTNQRKFSRNHLSRASAQRGAGFFTFFLFVLMLISTGLMYYFYLKSERLEREVRRYRQYYEPPPSTDNAVANETEGVPPEQESPANETSSSPTLTSRIDGPAPQPEPAPTEDATVTPLSKPPVSPVSVPPQSSAENSSPPPSTIANTPLPTAEPQATARPRNQVSETTPRPQRNTTPPPTTKPRKKELPAHISSIYDLTPTPNVTPAR